MGRFKPERQSQNDATIDGTKPIPSVRQEHVQSAKKLFVTGLPPTYTNNDFNILMGTETPVKKSFIITKPGSKVCTGIGFAIYGTEEDAHKTKSKLNRVLVEKDGKQFLIQVKFSDKKEHVERKAPVNVVKPKMEEESDLLKSKPISVPTEKKEKVVEKKEEKPIEKKKEEKLNVTELEKNDKKKTTKVVDDILDQIEKGCFKEEEDLKELKKTRKEREREEESSSDNEEDEEVPSKPIKTTKIGDGHFIFEPEEPKKVPQKTDRKDQKSRPRERNVKNNFGRDQKSYGTNGKRY
ncbi:hypothetical protein EIN_403660 [Entamoeba invadens IP1]|uniref:RRM domain-containing protein n=1 Tax=Entamoeba invadens IP1 TaxID=370355 RepID=A0A0A1U6K8_ENTIV|nr:hypothetical protein EIN_403660 [Entamoeba invadens IP1]ELP90032.1 hypothetical protein EIN_403660 [Entamoeba invadens IP1]|eukprot:XP_004256803.1 hypothetical protein EIN_403660 [Entamoeba invadens IP1]